MLENKVIALHIDDQEELLKAAEDMILKPSDIDVQDEDEKERLRQLKDMCKGFTMSDEQLQHIEKRMIMEINWGLGKDTNTTSNIKSYITYVSQLPTGRESGAYLALDLGGTKQYDRCWTFRAANLSYSMCRFRVENSKF